MHVINKLMALVLFVSIISMLHNVFLLAISCIAIIGAGLLANAGYYSLFKKVKWILLSMALVYALTTPGQLLFNHANFLSVDFNVVTKEGLLLAAQQTLHLMTMLAGVTLLLHTTTKEHLIAGFYQLGKLVFHHEVVSRFVVRLWLVLYYFEQQPIRIKNIGSALLQFENSQLDDDLQSVNVSLQPYKMNDMLTLVAMVILSFIAIRYFK
jgi:energy-coupling factor transporter transmembrane protein EcfT